MRIIFFAGKGGVGKTSLSSATGIKAASLGYKTIVMSLDTAHSLSDIFDLDKKLLDQNKGKPIPVKKNLWIQELDIQEEIQKDWGEIHQYVTKLLNATGVEEIMAEELAVIPGMEELSLLLNINRYVREGKYDVIILDSAPTGEAVRFISIPTVLEWYMKKFFKLERTMMKVARPVVEKLYKVPMPSDDIYEAIKDLFERLKGVDHVLSDPEITTVRMVSNPEKIVLKETQRGFMYFTLYKMHIDAIVMNRILPTRVKDDYFKGWRKNQRNYIKKAKEYFAPVPIFPVDLFPGEVLGYDKLMSLADKVYGDKDPVDIFHKDKAYDLSKQNGKYRLAIRLPFVEKTDVKVSRTTDELIIRLGSFKRHVLLPMHVAKAKKARAKFEEDNLCIYFED